MTARRRALLLTLASLVAWEAWEGLRPLAHPWADLSVGMYTDHFSHMNAARLFPRVGRDLWRRPVRALLREMTPDELRRMPPDVQAGGSWTGSVHVVDGWPPDKPMVTSWSHNPRLYPPGDLLLVAPVAALYHFTGLSLAGANRLLIVLLLLYAHVAIFLFLDGQLATPEADRPAPLVWFLVLGVVYLEVVHWTLEGFYDAAALAPLIVSVRSLRARRGLGAVVAYCVAAVIHFRAFFFGAWPVEGLVEWVRAGGPRRLRARDVAALAVAALVGATSLYVFWLLSPTLVRLPVKSLIHPGGPAFEPLALAGFLLGMALVGAALVRARAFRELPTFGWLGIMLLAVREAYPWHIVLAVLPWLCAPSTVRGRRAATVLHLARLATLALAVGLVFGAQPFKVWNLVRFR